MHKHAIFRANHLHLAIQFILNNSFKAKFCFMKIILLTADKYNVIYTTQKKIRAVYINIIYGLFYIPGEDWN